jgi:hypothetical protein
MLPLLNAFALICGRLRNVLQAEIWCWIPKFHPIPLGYIAHVFDHHIPWGFFYFSPGTVDEATKIAFDYNASQEQQRTMVWGVGDWRPNGQLHTNMRKIGEDQYGNELSELFVDPIQI